MTNHEKIRTFKVHISKEKLHGLIYLNDDEYNTIIPPKGILTFLIEKSKLQWKVLCKENSSCCHIFQIFSFFIWFFLTRRSSGAQKRSWVIKPSWVPNKVGASATPFRFWCDALTNWATFPKYFKSLLEFIWRLVSKNWIFWHFKTGTIFK